MDHAGEYDRDSSGIRDTAHTEEQARVMGEATTPPGVCRGYIPGAVVAY
jgi:hypothetical protein